MSFQPDITSKWLDIVYSETPGFINICSTLNWAGRCYPSGDTDIALEYIQELDKAGAEGIYLRATTLRSVPESGRGSDELSFYLPGLWADIDIAGPGHKTSQQLPPDVASAMRIVDESGLPEPSHWVHSGGGLYPWWLLRNPIEISDLEDFRALSGGWQKVLEASAKKLGYHYGSGVGDLSRVLRIPGTVNRKAGIERPCAELEGHSWDGPLYEAADLFEALAAATPDPVPQEPSRLEVKLNRLPGFGVRPGDDFNNKVSWRDLLLPLGWQWVYKRGDKWHLRRPGKLQGGASATLSDTTGNLYVFSEECHPLKSFEYYSPFAFYTAIEHNGDFASAAKELGRLGYGTPRDVDSDSQLVFASVKTATRPAVAAQTANDPAPMEQVPVELDSLGLPKYPDTVFGQEPWDQVGAARIWTSIFKDVFAHSSAQKTWSRWGESAWCEDEQEHHGHSASLMVERIRNYARQAEAADPEGSKNLARKAEKLCTNGAIEAILKIAAKDPRIAVKPSDFDKDPNLMTVGNGTLNLQTGQLGPHDPKNMLTRLVNADFKPEAKTGRWHEFMEQILPDPEVRNYLQRACGYMLTGTLNERVMFLIHGESGTGKTQFLEALRSVLGDFAGVAPASAFQPRQQGYKGPSEDLHKLKGKRLVIQSELDAGSKLNESLVKSIIGGDTQTTRPLYGAPVDWEPEYTVFMATNYLPRISSSDNAIWNRVKPIKFEQVFIDNSGQALDPSCRNLGRKMAKEEPEVILNWLLEGLRLYQEHGLKEPAQVSEWTQNYRDDVDTTRQFIAEAPEEGRIKVEPTAQVTVRELYRTYTAWCQDNTITPVGSKTFNERMLSSGWKKEKRERGITWLGIGLAGWIGEAQQPAVVKTWERRQ